MKMTIASVDSPSARASVCAVRAKPITSPSPEAACQGSADRAATTPAVELGNPISGPSSKMMMMQPIPDMNPEITV